MPIDARIIELSSGNTVKVTPHGELVVGNLEYSTQFGDKLDVINTPFEIVPAKIKHKFVITGFFITALKDVSPTVEADVSLYEASPIDLTTSTTDIIEVALIRGSSFVATGTRIATQEGVSLVATTDDATVNVAISGYYIKNGS